MRYWKAFLTISVATIAMTVGASALAPSALAQVRAALMRNVDEPARQPFRSTTDIVFAGGLNEQQFVVKVPTGKRLVIDHISWVGSSSSDGRMTFGALKASEDGAFVDVFQINPAHSSAAPSFIIQDGSQQGPVFFEPGEEVWLSMSWTGADRFATVYLNGHYITL